MIDGNLYADAIAKKFFDDARARVKEAYEKRQAGTSSAWTYDMFKKYMRGAPQ